MKRAAGNWGALARTAVRADGAARCRRCLGLTQSDFADAVGVGRVTVARWETGVIRPTARHVAAMLDLLAALVTESSVWGSENGELRERFAAVVLFGARTRLAPAAWRELLDLPASALTGVPTSEGRDGKPLASGYEVGLWLERKLRRKGPRFALDGDGAREIGERRLMSEIVFLAEGLRGSSQ
ncbi:MAG: helix-turn-helix domain-containing protein [Gemmatimonadaceae bacterium]